MADLDHVHAIPREITDKDNKQENKTLEIKRNEFLFYFYIFKKRKEGASTRMELTTKRKEVYLLEEAVKPRTNCDNIPLGI